MNLRFALRSALGASVLAALLALAFAPSPASACGGCFGPTGQATEVTAHRMAVMLTADETTLWDQFEYTGAPEDFVWVLPVAGTDDVQIELAHNDFFVALSQATQIKMQGPFRATGRSGGSGIGCGAADAAPSAGEGPANSVTVYGQETVGPYETVVIGSESPTALVDWLGDNGYGVPRNMEPAIAHYVDLGMNFVALRLAPGQGVDRMQPVRVTTPGMNTSFPLRMVGAGVSDSVSLELFVLAEGRYEAENFDNLSVDRSEIHYDWAAEAYNYDTLAADTLEESAGGGWLIEVADDVWLGSFQDVIIPGDPATNTESWPAEAADDFDHVIAAFQERPVDRYGQIDFQDNVFVTRMRAELPFDALRVDLNLQASRLNRLGRFIQVEREINIESDPSRSTSGLTEASFPLWPLVLLAGFVGFSVRRKRR